MGTHVNELVAKYATKVSEIKDKKKVKEYEKFHEVI